MTVQIYKNYNVLAHEKVPVYTASGPISEIYDVLSVKIPDEFQPSENAGGTLLLTPPGQSCTYSLDELLRGKEWTDDPTLAWYINASKYPNTHNLKVVSE